MTAQPQKAGTVYRFIRVPELNQNTNTVVLIKNSNQTESSTIAKVQKNVQQTAPAKIVATEGSGGKKVSWITVLLVDTIWWLVAFVLARWLQTLPAQSDRASPTRKDQQLDIGVGKNHWWQ